MPVEACQTPQWLITIGSVGFGVILGFSLNLVRETIGENKKREKNKSFIKSEIDLNLKRLREFWDKTKKEHGDPPEDVTVSFLKENLGASGFIEWSKNFFQGQLLPLALTLKKEDMDRILEFYRTLDTINNYYSKFEHWPTEPGYQKEMSKLLEIIKQTLQEGNPIKD